MDTLGQIYDQFKVTGRELAAKVRDLIHEGNVRRIIIKDERGNTFMEIPLTVATIGIVAAPVVAAVGAVATLFAHFEIVVERVAAGTPASSASAPVTDPSVGATENKVDMVDTVPQHVDKKGTKLEDIAGTGQHDSLGG